MKYPSAESCVIRRVPTLNPNLARISTINYNHMLGVWLRFGFLLPLFLELVVHNDGNSSGRQLLH